MLNRLYYIISSLLLVCISGYSQQIATGIVKDKSTLEPVPFASIGISSKGIGTLSDEKGNFSLNISDYADADTILISAIGYKNLSIPTSDIKIQKKYEIFLVPMVYDLTEVKVKPKKSSILGTYKYSTRNCTAFTGKTGNWKGQQAAIQANNPEGVTVYFETFSFYIIKNLYEDSLQFRVMLYNVAENEKPGTTFLQKPVLFKTKAKQGEVIVDLKPYDIVHKGDFFISLECLEDEMDATKFCFAGSIGVPSYFKSAFGKWGKVKGGGGDFNVKVKISK